MTSNVSLPRTALSPVSVAGSDWSGISKYHSGSDLYGPGGASQRNNSNSGMLGDGGNGGGGNPRTVSPPASIARSSDGAGLYAQSETSSLKGIIQEEEVAVHHSALKKLLQPYLAQQQLSGRPNKARDKLLRLSVIQFQELSTDVYDELQRREANALPGGGEKPPHLLPKDKFHPKRNQARQKLSTLAMERFRDLATDVYYELERRFPQFGDGSGSPTAAIMSLNGLPPNRVGSPAPGRSGSPGPGMMPPGRVGSPGPGRVGSPGPRNGPPPGGYAAYNGGGGGPPRLGSPGMPPRNGPMSPQGAFGRPLPKTYQAGNLIPNKSTMVEDDDDGLGDDSDHEGAFGLEDRRSNGMNGRAGMKRDSNRSISSLRNGVGAGGERIVSEYKSKIETLQDKVSALEGRLDDRNREISELKNGERRRESTLNIELEGKLAEAQNLNKSLQEEISRLKGDTISGGGGAGGDKKYSELLQEHEQLKAELREQEEVTEEVRREAMEFLNQMKSISERADNFYEKEERMHADYQKLQDEVKEWKARYARTKATLRNLRTSSIGFVVPSPANMTSGFSDPNGLVKDVHITKFQIAIDEFLRTARGANCSQTLDFVKGVVVATRAIMENVEDSPNDDRGKLKARVSATANNLTTAAKNHALSQGLSPVSLVDAAASHLCASVVELVKVVKVRTSVGGELDEEDDGEDEIRSPDSPSMNGMFGGKLHPENGNQQQQQQPMQNGNVNGNAQQQQQQTPQIQQNRLSGESVYSPLASPRSSHHGEEGLQFPPQDAKGRNGSVGGRAGGAWGDIAPSLAGVGSPPRQPPFHGLRVPDNSNVEELRVSLETQTEGIVENIQHLLSSIRAGDDMDTLQGHVEQIASVVDKVVKNTEDAMEQSGNERLRERGDWIVSNLAGCAGKMRAATGGPVPADGPADKEFRGGLAALAFDLARETKDLVRTVEEISDESRRPGGISVDDLR